MASSLEGKFFLVDPLPIVAVVLLLAFEAPIVLLRVALALVELELLGAEVLTGLVDELVTLAGVLTMSCD